MFDAMSLELQHYQIDFAQDTAWVTHSELSVVVHVFLLDV